MENRFSCINGQSLKIAMGLAPTLAGIFAASLLEVTERLRAQTTPMLARTELHHLMDKSGKLRACRVAIQKAGRRTARSDTIQTTLLKLTATGGKLAFFNFL
jgi:hypothetical protein